MKPSLEKKFLKDFNEFLKAENVEILEKLSRSVFRESQKYLAPKSTLVFVKVLGLHLIAGVFSLIICDQFGIRPFDIGFSLSQYFMTWGHSVCMFLCGLVFLLASMLTALVVLRHEELVVLKKNSWLFILSLVLFSLGFFFVFGAELVLSFTLLWIVGALVGGLIPLLFVRRHLYEVI